MTSGAGQRGFPESNILFRGIDHVLDAAGEIFRIIAAVQDSTISQDFGVFRSIVGDDDISLAHGFDEGRMGSAYLRGMDVTECVSQQLPVSGAINGSGEENPPIRGLMDSLDIFPRVGGITDGHLRAMPGLKVDVQP